MLFRSQGPLEVGGEGRVGLRREELVHRARVVEATQERVVARDLRLEAGEAGRDLLGVGLIGPEVGARRLGLEGGQLRALALDVKGTPSRRRGVP